MNEYFAVNGTEYPTKALLLMLVPTSPEQKGIGSPTFTGKKKKKRDSEVKVFTRASISRIQRTFCPFFDHSLTVHRASPAGRTQQDLIWALATVLDISPGFPAPTPLFTWGHDRQAL